MPDPIKFKKLRAGMYRSEVIKGRYAVAWKEHDSRIGIYWRATVYGGTHGRAGVAVGRRFPTLIGAKQAASKALREVAA